MRYNLHIQTMGKIAHIGDRMSLNITIKIINRNTFEVVDHSINSALKEHKTKVHSKSFSPFSCVVSNFLDKHAKAHLMQFSEAVENYATKGMVNSTPYGITYTERTLNKNDADLKACLSAIQNGEFFVNGEVGIGAMKRIAELAGLKVEETYNRGQKLTGATIKAQ